MRPAFQSINQDPPQRDAVGKRKGFCMFAQYQRLSTGFKSRPIFGLEILPEADAEFADRDSF